jgi:uncharacterized protein (DUF4415 family)
MTMARNDMQSFSFDELKRQRDAGKTATQPDAPAYAVPDDFWAAAELRMPATPGKTHISMRIDTDVLEWYRQQGSGYLTRMNAVLRSFMEQRGDRQPAPSAREANPDSARPNAGSPAPARRRKTS